LNAEQRNQDDDGDGDYVRLEEGRRDLEALNRAQHGDCRGDHAVAVKERGPEESRHHQHDALLRGGLGGRSNQGGQRDDPSLSVVVGPHHEGQVFDRYDDDQGPQDQRKDAEDVRLRGIDSVSGAERFPSKMSPVVAMISTASNCVTSTLNSVSSRNV